MAVAVLGPMVVGDNAAIAPRERIVLAALVVRRGQVVSADTLADALWADAEPPASRAKVVQGCIVRLRKVLGASAIETHPNGYRFVLPGDEVDAGRFERLVAQARELLTLNEPDRAAFALDEALGLWRGPAFVDLEDWDAAQIEAARLDELRLDAEELRLEAALRAGRYREVLADAQARVAQAPLREHRWMLLALAQNQAGRQGEALRTLHRARQMLARELGLDPGADLVALEAAILRQDPTLLVAGLPPPSQVCPYRGLTAYDVGDADTFHGREAEIAECLDRIHRHGLLAVVGPSGAGKSSLIRAGIAAALARARHRITVITPGAEPLRTLAAVEPTTTLIVDQCEEAFSLCRDAVARTRFFDALAEHASRAPLVVGLRADRLGDLAAFPAFATLIERCVYLLRGMDARRLRQAIEAPARQAGLLIEPGLVDLLVREVEGEPGSLPLLSHALAQTWERREGQTLTVAGYRASGGIRGAVAQSAEHVYDQLAAEQRPLLRDLMLRLVVTTADGEPVRSRVSRRVAAPDPDHVELVDALSAARLVTSDADSVELAHESLARAWPRLRDWLDDDVEGQRIWRHLTAAADTWDDMGRPDSELYRGARRARVAEWRKATSHNLSRTECDFLDASEQLEADERALAEQRARRALRANRRLRVLIAAASALAVAATAGGVVALRQARRADDAAASARSHELAASAIGALDHDPTLAKLLAVAAAEAGGSDNVAVDAALHQAWATDLAVARWGFAGEVGVLTADINPAGDRLAAAGLFQEDGAGWTIQVVDPFTDELDWSIDVGASGAASAFVAAPFFADDGEHVVAGTYWDPDSWRRSPIAFDGVDEPLPDLLGAHIWDAATGELIERIDLGRCGGVVVAMSTTHLVARTLHGPPDVIEGCRWRDGSIGVELVDRRTGARDVLTQATGVGVWSWGVAMSADGRRVAYDDAAAGEAVVIDVASRAEVARLPVSGVRDLAADGSLLLAGDRPIEVFDVATATTATSFDGHNGPSLHARFTPSGTTVYSVGDDGALREWDATTGRELFAYPDIGSGPIGLNASGRVVVSSHDQQYVTVLDRTRRGEVGSAAACGGRPVPDTLHVVHGLAVVHHQCAESTAATTLLVDLATGATSTRIPGREVGALAVSPDGSRFVDQAHTRDAPGALAVRSLPGGDEVTELAALPGRSAWPHAHRLRWSPDGRLIAGALETSMVVWNADTGALLHAADGPALIVDITFSSDSTSLIATTDDRRISRRSLTAWDSMTATELFFEGSYWTGLIGDTADGSSLLAVGGYHTNAASTLVWLDRNTLTVQRTRPNLHEGSVTSATLSDDRTLMATAASDGSVRVWDTATGALVHDVPGNGTAIESIDFVDDRHLVLAPDGGGLDTITIDSGELLDLVRGSLTRGFTLADCQRFNFGDACPTIAELGGMPVQRSAIEGRFSVTLTTDDFVDVVDRASLERFGIPPPEGSLDELATTFAGSYSLALSKQGFELAKAGTQDPACVGTFRIVDDHIWLRSERGDCYPIKFLDAKFELTDDSLRLDPHSARADFPWWVVLTSRPLQRDS